MSLSKLTSDFVLGPKDGWVISGNGCSLASREQAEWGIRLVSSTVTDTGHFGLFGLLWGIEI